METCYPSTADWTCADETLMDEMTPEAKARAEMLGWQALRVLTGFQTGNCPVTVRPCSRGCFERQTWTEAVAGELYTSGGPFNPHIHDGAWVNSCGCTSSDCSCSQLPTIYLPGPIAEVTEVKVDGIVLATDAYMVLSEGRLVRIDGERWPACQNLGLPDTEEGTFSVTYRQGYPIDSMVNIAAGVLAMEFYLACSNNPKCRLPANVQTVARQGVTIELSPGIFAGPTNIPEVEVVVRSLNPYNLKTPPVIWSPSMARWAR